MASVCILRAFDCYADVLTVVNSTACVCTKFLFTKSQHIDTLYEIPTCKQLKKWSLCYKSSNYKIHLSQWNQVLWIRLSNKKHLYAQPRERSSDRWIKQMTLRRSINLTCGCRWATLLYRARPQNCWALLIMCVIRSGSTYFMPGKWCVFNGSHILPSLCNISDRVPVSLATINQHQGLSG